MRPGIRVVRGTATVIAVMVLGLSVGPAGAARAPQWVKIYDGRTGPKAIARAFITPDGPKIFAISNTGGVVTIRARATNVGTNHREVFWPASQRNLVDSGVCATWAEASTSAVQQGLAFRIISQPGRTRAVTVMKNVIFGYTATINVGVWDTRTRAQASAIAAYDMAAVLIDSSRHSKQPLPWRMCARLHGHTLQFKVWLPQKEREPAWNDPVHARSTDAIPASHQTAGKTGWYFGHLPPAGDAQYKGLSIWAPRSS